MKKCSWIMAAMVAAAVLGQSKAEAITITFHSGDGGDTVNGGSAVAIAPHPLWGDVSTSAGLAAGTAEWISYANTGYGALVAPNAANRDIGNQTALFSRSFDLLDVSDLSLWVLADDTASVRLLGPGGYSNALYTAFPGQIDPCAPGGTGAGLGCVQADMGISTVANLGPGLYTLQIFAFQTNYDVFGAQYAGNIHSVPEPGTLLLVGTGLMGFVATRRRRQVKS